MAAGQIYKGKNVRFSLNGKTLFHATTCSISISTTLESIATKDTNGTLSVPGNYEWSMSTSALVADKPAGSTQSDFMDLLALQLSGAEIDIEFTTGEAGDFLLKGKVFIESSSINAETGNSVSGDFSFKGNGDLTPLIAE
ncbi:phage tail tube protein [Myroides sp. JBRI-B21084]|uniref:phage tail tube protein n=1 Tax=Myroides sp. JBRI-B21084 TaxID=3119977 RepID=UPI0026E2ECB8|nr:phage tail tube protein [Paenimyroides cloacae]WKW47261.1 phage tail tube protein [Paenimyroides cloacae]